MASNYSPLQNLIILTLISTTLVFYATAAGDEQLIDKLCSVTFAPVACTSCVKNGKPPAGPNWTDVDVVQGMLTCGDDDFQGLEEAIMKVIDDSGTDENVRSAMQDCNKPIQSAIYNGGVVAQEVAEKRFTVAKSDIPTLIFQKLQDCDTIMKTAGITPPGSVFSGLLSVESDFKIALQILNSLAQ